MNRKILHSEVDTTEDETGRRNNSSKISFNFNLYWAKIKNDDVSHQNDPKHQRRDASHHESKALKIDVLSNLAFFIGSSCYLITAFWDRSWYEKSKGFDDDYYAYHQDSITFTLDSYTLISIFGASMMIFNAAFDLYLCVHMSKSSDIDSFYHKEILFPLLAAVSFGIAAIIDLRITFLSGELFNLKQSTIVSTEIYLLSAILALMPKPSCQYSTTEGHLCLIGDWLFLIGSLIDVIISYISDPDIVVLNGGILSGINVFSSILWLIDAGEIFIM